VVKYQKYMEGKREGQPPREREPRHEGLHLEMGMATAPAVKRIEEQRPNEDSGFIKPDLRQAAVFDGMGGHAAGQLASEIACKVVEGELKTLSPQADENEVRRALFKALNLAHIAVAEKAKELKNNMGTTAAVGIVIPQGEEALLVMGWVGDSRVQLIRAGQAEILTLDDAGWHVEFKIPPHERRHQQDIQAYISSEDDLPFDAEPSMLIKDPSITQHLGMRDYMRQTAKINIHISVAPLWDGDLVLLTSDGIHDPVELPLIARIVSQYPPQVAARKLIEAARLTVIDDAPRAKDDDATAEVIRISLPKKA
jgi:serine/threonine protein phosphatase PrpC